MSLRPVVNGVISGGSSGGGGGDFTKAEFEAAIDFAVMYPGGDATTPGNIVTSTRSVLTNPFPTFPVLSRVEVLIAGVWGDPGFTYSSGTFAGYGVKVTQIANGSNYGDLVVQSGSGGVAASAGATGGPHPTATGGETSLPFRVIVWKVKR